MLRLLLGCIVDLTRTRGLLVTCLGATAVAGCVDYGVVGSKPEEQLPAPTPAPDLPPIALISLPADDASLPTGRHTFVGVVADAEDAADTLEVWWASDLQGLVANTIASEDGTVSDDLLLTVGSHTITLWARDDAGQVGSHAVHVTIVGTDTCFDGIDNDGDGQTDEGEPEIHGDGIDQDCTGETVVTFDPTGGPQEFPVPEGVIALTVKMWGAGGAVIDDPEATADVNGDGGAGGYSDGVLPVTPGEILAITVGGAGEEPPHGDGWGGAGGYGGGGGGGDCKLTLAELDNGGGGGGGASEVASTGGVITAGGGGGAGWGTVWGTSGAGGGEIGGTGSKAEACPGGAAGQGGGDGMGGAGGIGCADAVLGQGNGLPGDASIGGKGGSDTTTTRCRGGGGGGGGHGGGGGGGGCDSAEGGVGGGGGGRTVPGGTTVAGYSTIPANELDPARGDAGEPGQGGLVILILPD